MASSLFKSRALNRVHLNQVRSYNSNEADVKEEDNAFHEPNLNENEAANISLSAEKQCMYRYEAAYHHKKPQQKSYAHKRGSEPLLSKTIRGDSSTASQTSSSDDEILGPKKTRSKVRILRYCYTLS